MWEFFFSRVGSSQLTGDISARCMRAVTVAWIGQLTHRVTSPGMIFKVYFFQAEGARASKVVALGRRVPYPFFEKMVDTLFELL